MKKTNYNTHDIGTDIDADINVGTQVSTTLMIAIIRIDEINTCY